MRALVVAACLAAVLATSGSATAAVTVGGTGWYWANPLPQGDDLTAEAFSGSRGVAVGAGGVIVRSEDGGATWTAAASGTDAGLSEVAMPDANTVYVGGDCVLRRSTDGGATFQRVAFTQRESGCRNELAEMAFPTTTTGYLILSDGTVLRTTNGGRTFARRASLQIGSSVPQGVAEAVFSSETTGLVATGLYDPPLLRTEDGGQSWAVIRPTANGSPLLARARGVAFVSPLVAYAVGDSGQNQYAKTEDGGATWTPLPLAGATGRPRAIRCVDASTCVILSGGDVGQPSGNLVTWTADGGQTGTTIASGADLHDLAYSSATRVVGVGDGGVTLASDDGGHTFSRVGGAVAGAFRGLRWGGGQTVFAFPSNGALARSTDGGATWASLGIAPVGDLIDTSWASDTVGYLLQGDGTIQRTDDAGASWGVLGAELSGARALHATGPDSLLVGTPGGIQRSLDAGATFAPARGASRPVRGFDNAGASLIAFAGRTLLASDDGGASWKALGRPPRGGIASADFVSQRIGYVVQGDGDVFATRNAGRAWKRLDGVGRSDIAAVSFGDARHGFLLLRRSAGLGGVLRTSNGGRTWRPQVLSERPLAAVLALGANGGTALSARTGHLFSTGSGGDAGASSRLTLRVASKRRVGRRTAVTIAGRLRPASAGAGVSVTARINGRWVRKFALTSANGRFRTTWRLRTGTVFVAQWRGAPGLQAAGTPALRVRLGRHKRR